MVVLGLLLIASGVLVILAGLFTAERSSGGDVEILGIEVTPVALFLLGVAAGLAVLWGFGILKYGTKREIRTRREHRRLSKQNRKLQQEEARRTEETPPA